MAVNVNTRVAPLGSDTQAKVSALDMFQRFSGVMGHNANQGIPDPRADVMETVGGIPRQEPSPEVERGIPMLESNHLLETQQDLADASGSPYPQAASVRPMLDENNQIMIDPETGENLYEPITMDDQNAQLMAERASHFGIKGSVNQIAEGDTFGGLDTLFAEELRASENSWGLNSRSAKKLDERTKTLTGYIQSAAPDLDTAVKNAEDALLSPESKATVMVDDGQGGQVAVPAGYKVLADSGITDQETARVVATMSGLAFNQAVGQLGVAKTSSNTEAPPVDDGDYESNMINSVRHSLVNGMERMGIKTKDGGVDLLAKSIVMHNINSGNLVPTGEPGRVVLRASPELKRQAMNLLRVSEAIAGETKRKGASSVPTHAGSSITRGKPGMTQGAIRGYVTAAADLTKSILGAVAQTFRPKDVMRKKLELSLVLSKEFVYAPNGVFQYSVHPFAKRNALHKGAWLSAWHNVKRDPSFDPKDPRSEIEFQKIQTEEANKVMAEKKALAEFDIANIDKAKGALYSEYIHSSSNQRFYPNSFNTDYMSSKATIRDVLALAHQDAVKVNSLFDVQPIEILHRKVGWIFQGSGQKINENLEKLSPTELGTLGAMHNAVLYYYTAIEPGKVKNVSKLPVADAIRLYTPAIGARLADLGDKYNAYLADPSIVPDNEMMALWVATDKGEALSSLNLWDDFSKASRMFKDPRTKGHSMGLTHHTIADGNQNGIFLQALFFGLKDNNASADALLRTTVANPSMDDMRVFGMDTMAHHLQDMLQDSPDKAKAWAGFWSDAIANHPDGRDGVAKDFFKKPLMQNAYGKDAAMFTDVLMELIESDEVYSALARKHFIDTGIYGSTIEAGTDLSSAVEMTLRKLIDSGSVTMMKNIGRFHSTLNRPITYAGPTGDTIVIVPVGVTPVNKEVSNAGSIVAKELPDGTEVLLKKPSYVTDSITNPDTGDTVDVPTYKQGPMPGHTKGVQLFWDRKKQRYDEFGNARGTTQGRQLAVLSIQALDGELVKSAAILVNKDRIRPEAKSSPRPVLFVHDSSISTPGSALVYNNAYNNIAIPASIPKIAEMGKVLQNETQLAVSGEKARVIERDQPVGIGANGDYPALGAVFDEFAERIIELGKPEDYAVGSLTTPNDYKAFSLRTDRTSARANRKKAAGSLDPKKRFQERMAQSGEMFGPSPEEKWLKKKTRIQSILVDARKHGWVPETEMNTRDAENLAVRPKDFGPLVDLAGELLRMGNMKAWTDDHKRRVELADKRLRSATMKGGIHQLSADGGKAASKKGYNPGPVGETENPLAPPDIKAAVAIPMLDRVFDTDEPVPF